MMWLRRSGCGRARSAGCAPRRTPEPTAGPALEMPLASTGAPGQDGSQAGRDDSEGERGQEREAGGGLAAGPGATAPAGQERAAAPRIAAGTFECRYAGAMLAHAYLDRAGIGPILTGLDGGPWRRFDQAQIATFTVTALLLGVSSVEGIKALI